MRVLIFHGYLLAGTGSNVYNARLAEALVGLGHEVHIFCQDRHPERQPFVDAVGDWDGGALALRVLRTPARCTVYRPAIGGLLPVYVADRYEGFEARTFADCSEDEVNAYVDANVAAVSEVAERARPQAALANHLVMGPLVLARALAARRIPYAVKVHGSALEYTVKPNLRRFGPAAREGLAAARGILVGSRHTAVSLWQAMDDPTLPPRTRLGPPGVDVERFAPRPADEARARLQTLARRLQAGGPAETTSEGDAFARDPSQAGAALAQLDPGRQRLVAFVGKLLVAKGVDLLVAAWPLVLDAIPDARMVVVGFGAYRVALEKLVAALQAGDLEQVRAIAQAGRALQDPGAPAAPLRHLLGFVDGLSEAGRERYLAAARRLSDHLVFTGRLEHDELADLLPACEALVVPSTFPEAFGMVAVEAAACGALPLSAAHSGLAEVTDTLAAAVPPPAAQWLSFRVDADPVPAIAERLVAWMGADPELRQATRRALVATARERYSWPGVARGVISAAEGRLDDLAQIPA